MRRKLPLLAFLLLLALVIAVLARRTRQPPWLPSDAEHRFVDVETCLTCHGPDGPLPRSRNHPVGRDCLRCHGTR